MSLKFEFASRRPLDYLVSEMKRTSFGVSSPKATAIKQSSLGATCACGPACIFSYDEALVAARRTGSGAAGT